MRVETITVSQVEYKLGALNTAQAEELLNFSAETSGKLTGREARERRWKTLLLSLNNAEAPPTKEKPLGSHTEPKSREDLQFLIDLPDMEMLHATVLQISGLQPAQPAPGDPAGEPQAAA